MSFKHWNTSNRKQVEIDGNTVELYPLTLNAIDCLPEAFEQDVTDILLTLSQYFGEVKDTTTGQVVNYKITVPDGQNIQGAVASIIKEAGPKLFNLLRQSPTVIPLLIAESTRCHDEVKEIAALSLGVQLRLLKEAWEITVRDVSAGFNLLESKQPKKKSVEANKARLGEAA